MTRMLDVRSSYMAAAALAVFGAVAASGTAHAQEQGRFDAQVFRPSAAPRDLVVVQKSEVMGHKSPTVGVFTDLGFDPLVLFSQATRQTVRAVAARFQITGLAAIGLFDWADVKLAVPFIAWQSSDNLRPIGTEGEVQAQSVGDVRLATRVAVPYLNRKNNVNSGFGMAVEGNLNLPTGSVNAFAGDGVLTGGVTVVGDYRFGVGALVTANAGVWFRPERQFVGARIGDMGHFGVAGEAYLVQRWGLSMLGGVYGYPALNKFPDSAREVPAEVMLALRYQSKSRVTWTFGGTFGAACAFGAPALRLFSGLSIIPASSTEAKKITEILLQKTHDPDGDGLTEEVDKCPEVPGPAENAGCPDDDSDDDGIIDRKDECPSEPAGPDGKDGCPPAFIKGDQIVILDKVHFETDKDAIQDDSKRVLEAVARVLIAHPEIELVQIEGHTDVRASDAYNWDLSQRRVNSVRAYLIAQGVATGRIEAKGYGHTQPLYDDTDCDLPDEQLSKDCLFRTSKNRRVVFRIVRWTGKGEAPELPQLDGSGAPGATKGDGALPGSTGPRPQSTPQSTPQQSPQPLPGSTSTRQTPQSTPRQAPRQSPQPLPGSTTPKR